MPNISTMKNMKLLLFLIHLFVHSSIENLSLVHVFYIFFEGGCIFMPLIELLNGCVTLAVIMIAIMYSMVSISSIKHDLTKEQFKSLTM